MEILNEMRLVGLEQIWPPTSHRNEPNGLITIWILVIHPK